MKLEQHIEKVLQELTQLVTICFELGEDVKQKTLRVESLRDDIKMWQGKLAGLRERQHLDREDKKDSGEENVRSTTSLSDTSFE